MTAERLVVILCGPPGAGKTTAARHSGLQVFDRDDAQWTSERQFLAALSELRLDPSARAVLIRRGATSSARLAAKSLTAATHTFLLTASLRELEARVRARARADMVQGLQSLRSWFAEFDRGDGVPDFPGWQPLLGEALTPTSEAWL